MRVARNCVVNVNRDAELLQSLFKGICAVLAGILGNYYASDVEAASAELVDQTEYITVVGDAEVTADFVFLNIGCGNCHNNLGLIGKLHQHPQLTVGLKTRKHPGGMVVVKSFPPNSRYSLSPNWLIRSRM